MRSKKIRNLYGPTRGQMALILCVVLVLVMVSLGVAFAVLYKPPVPSGDDLPFSTDTNPPDSGNTPVNPDNPDNPGQPPVPIYTARDSVYNFLIVGHDRAAMLADVIMLVNFDVNAGKVAIMQIPRDTYINAGSNVPQINVLFAALYNRAVSAKERNPAQVAADRLAEALEQNLCIQIQYTAVMNLDGFGDIVNAVGGVDVDIPADMDYEDPEQDLYIHLKAGLQHLDGDRAEDFVRFRDGYVQADIGRTNAQKIFLAAFIDKVKQSVSITNVPLITELAGTVVDNLTTDVTVADVVYFGKNALSVDLSSISMMTMPGDSVQVKSTGKWYYVANRDATLDVINTYFNIYDNDITDSIFDKNRALNDSSTPEINTAYCADKSAFGTIYDAEGVLDSSIDIPRNP